MKVDNDVLNANQVITCSNAVVKFVDQKHFIAFVSERYNNSLQPGYHLVFHSTFLRPSPFFRTKE